MIRAQERFAERRHTQRVYLHAVGALEAQLLDLRQREVGYLGALAGLVREDTAEVGGTQHVTIVAEDQDAVLGAVNIDFHDIRLHRYHALDGGDGILRPVAPVSAMDGHHHILGRRIVHLGGDCRGT